DRLQPGEKDHHVVRRGPPDAYQDHRPQRRGAAAQTRHRVDVEPVQDRVDHAVLLVHEGPDDGHHDRRHHHRHEDGRAQQVLDPQAAVEKHRQAERQGQHRHDAEQHVGERHPHRLQEQRILQQAREVRQPDELRRVNQIVLRQAEIERLDHRQEAENRQYGQSRQDDRNAERGLLRRKTQPQASPGCRARGVDERWHGDGVLSAWMGLASAAQGDEAPGWARRPSPCNAYFFNTLLISACAWSSEAFGSIPSYAVRSIARPTAWPISLVYSVRMYQEAVVTSFMCTSKNGKFFATAVSSTPFTGCTNATLPSHSSGLASMNLTKSQATTFCASGLALLTPHIQP